MSQIINLPANFIGKDDREKLESFGGHTIAHGRATRWHWDRNARGDDVFEIYHGGQRETLTARISRDWDLDAFRARDATGDLIVSSTLEHVFAELEAYFTRLHGEGPDIPA